MTEMFSLIILASRLFWHVFEGDHFFQYLALIFSFVNVLDHNRAFNYAVFRDRIHKTLVELQTSKKSNKPMLKGK